MADHPDIYVDGVAVGAGPFGMTITLLRSEPSVEPGAQESPNVIVGRVRMSHVLAKALAQNVNDALAQQSNVQQADSKIRN
jgi:hypothetical protein